MDTSRNTQGPLTRRLAALGFRSLAQADAQLAWVTPAQRALIAAQVAAIKASA